MLTDWPAGVGTKVRSTTEDCRKYLTEREFSEYTHYMMIASSGIISGQHAKRLSELVEIAERRRKDAK